MKICIFSSCKDRAAKQDGVFLAALGIIFVPLILIFIGLGIDAVRVKYARADLERIASNACTAAENAAPMAYDARAGFYTSVAAAQDAGGIRYGKIRTATFTMPTQPQAPGPSDTMVSSVPFTWRDSTNDQKVCPSGAFSYCANGSADWCGHADSSYGNIAFTYTSDPCSTGSTQPEHLWSIEEDAGAAMSCELTATVSSSLGNLMSFVPGGFNPFETPIIARVIVGSSPLPSNGFDRTKAMKFTDDPAAPAARTPSANIPFRPLSIAIAPELVTDGVGTGASKLFKFSPATPGLDLYDPAANPPPALGTSKGFSEQTICAGTTSCDVTRTASLPAAPTPRPVPATGALSGDAFLRSGADFTSCASGKDVTCVQSPIAFKATTTETSPRDEWSDAVASCVNPLVLARNIITSTVIEILGRTGAYRSTMELLTVNPKNDASANMFNRPVSVMTFGQDPFVTQYRTPFVYYNSPSLFDTTATNVRDSDMKFAKGWPYPWAGISPGNPTLIYQAEIVAQLRYCFNLYRGGWDATTGGEGISRYLLPLTGTGDTNIPTILDSKNSTFGYESLGTFEASRPLYTNTTTHRWDQTVPWQTLIHAEDLTAAEVAATLGTVQSCPIRGQPTFYDGQWWCCDKSSTTTAGITSVQETLRPCSGSGGSTTITEQRPDFVPLFKYFFADATLGTSTYAPTSYASPGMWYTPQDVIGDPVTDNPFNTDSSVSSKLIHVNENTLSTIFIVSHQTPEHNDATAIADIVGCTRRPIVVLYMPTSGDDDVGDWYTALEFVNDGTGKYIPDGLKINKCAPALDAESISSLRKVIYLSPKNPSMATLYPPLTPVAHPDSQYMQFWADMLNDQIDAKSNKAPLYAGTEAAAITQLFLNFGPRY